MSCEEEKNVLRTIPLVSVKCTFRIEFDVVLFVTYYGRQ